MNLRNKNVIITGASQGFGAAIAKAFVEQEANVILCARNLNKLQRVQQELRKIAHSSTKVLIQVTDVSKSDDVQNLIQTARKELCSVDILIANAGVYGTKGPIEEVDWGEWSSAIDINLKGTVLMCREVIPIMKRQGKGKIIILSGGGATKPMPNLSAYAASKAAVVRFAETLAEEVRDFKIDVNTIAPGALNTDMLDEIIAAGPEKVGEKFHQQSMKQKNSGGTPFSKGVDLSLFLASAESDGITGKLISAVWDKWQEFPSRRDVLNTSDIYTLRRITTNERSVPWSDVE